MDFGFVASLLGGVSGGMGGWYAGKAAKIVFWPAFDPHQFTFYFLLLLFLLFPTLASPMTNDPSTDSSLSDDSAILDEALSGGHETSYDEVPYQSLPYAQSHPDRMASMGTLFGMSPPNPSTARILELGCAAGGNILPIAVSNPETQVVGIDLSARQIKDGQEVVDALGLQNIELRHASITDLDDSLGKFDYIIAHGVFSWVPTEVQDHIFKVCSKNLTENGIAYISYNTHPGWHMRGMIRDMMCYHVADFSDSKTKIRQARSLLKFLSDNVPKERNKAYAELLTSELELLKKQADYYLFHDHLEVVNDPIYFHEFADRAGEAGLAYLGESSLASMLGSDFSPEVSQTLKQVAPNIIRMEQYMDFLRNRMFRQTLLVHKETKLKRELGESSLQSFYLAAPLKPAEENTEEELVTDAKQQFKSPSGHLLTTASPVAKIAIQTLGEHWPETVAFDDLVNTTREKLPADSPALTAEKDLSAQLGAELLRCLSHGLVECHVVPASFTRTIAEKPSTTALVRWQAKNKRPITNLRHESVKVDELGRHVLARLDGTRTGADLVRALCGEAAKGTISIKVNDLLVSDTGQLQIHLGKIVAAMLPRLGVAALLEK